MKVVIRAGGIGTRLWPYSRKKRPKQFHAMTGTATMLQDAVERVKPIASIEDIFVSTGAETASLVHEQLPGLSTDQIIVEPALRNTGPAVGLECALLEARDPGCIIASLGSDHYIGKNEEFCRLLRVAETALKDFPDHLFTLGVKPTRPETGYGYICRGLELTNSDGVSIYSVEAFTEKPDLERAKSYTHSGNYLWNSNMFVWKASTVLDLFKRYEPDMYAVLKRIADAVGGKHENDVIIDEYPKLKQIAVDNAIIERAENVATIEADIEWGDIGSWAALTDVLPVDTSGNLFSGDVMAIGTNNSTVYAAPEKIVALIGVDDLVVVDTEDALLVCRKEDAQRVREVIDKIGSEGRQKYT
ncbi:MAG: sugar phosphate nucleotidyltransferase [Candidatus Latescibacterota bacterium]|nr:sugar phosphate nucleotidyltransferase [Candidatus Latescibacterota bacterium]